MPRAGAQGPEQEARVAIDAVLTAAGWLVQDRDAINLAAGSGVAVREFPIPGGFADYLLYVDRQPVGVLEAKKAGLTLSGAEAQAAEYARNFPSSLDAPVRPLPFVYASTGFETKFMDLLDPEPKSRRIFAIHRPDSLAERLKADALPKWVTGYGGELESSETEPAYGRPSSFRTRISAMPPLAWEMWPNQRQGIQNLEASIKSDRLRSLIQMATGSGKTRLAVTSIYRLIKFGGARRVLFLVDRANLGEQAEKEFQSFVTPDDKRKFTELYVVQRLTGNTIGSASKVVITTIQRLFSMLRGEEDLDPELEESSRFTTGAPFAEPVHVEYESKIPPEFFDVIFVDECHRSIYSIWREVLEYFDSFLIGLTATPAKHTFGFFNGNLVMEYPHEKAVAEGVNVGFEVYKIRTEITAKGSKIEAGPGTMVGYRDRATRKRRWEQADEDITYGAGALDRAVVAQDQIRTIIQTFKDRLPEILPGRTHVPKTLIFAKDDSHAEDIVEIVRDVFGKGNEFCTKITYKASGKKKEDLIQEFRNGYNPRIAVTVDMIATGTDIQPIEIVMFLRAVKSRVLFEQMKGRGVRIIDPNVLASVTPDALAKTHFVIVDCVGITETDLNDTQPLERDRTIAFKALLEHVAIGGTDPNLYSSLASRLTRLDRQCGPEERKLIERASGGTPLRELAKAFIDALEPDRQIELARQDNALPESAEPNAGQIETARKKLLTSAGEPLATNPPLRQVLQEVKHSFEQLIDEVSRDKLIEAGPSVEASEKARALVDSFKKFLDENREEIDALKFFYSLPHRERLRYKDIKALAEAIKAPPRSWTAERLWLAYEALDKTKVRRGSPKRLLTDIVSLVRYALLQEDELIPYADKVRERFENWVSQQENTGRKFSDEQRRWLEMMRDHVAASLEITIDDFGFSPFGQEGGLGKAQEVFEGKLPEIIREMNEALAA